MLASCRRLLYSISSSERDYSGLKWSLLQHIKDDRALRALFEDVGLDTSKIEILAYGHKGKGSISLTLPELPEAVSEKEKLDRALLNLSTKVRNLNDYESPLTKALQQFSEGVDAVAAELASRRDLRAAHRKEAFRLLKGGAFGTPQRLSDLLDEVEKVNEEEHGQVDDLLNKARTKLVKACVRPGACVPGNRYFESWGGEEYEDEDDDTDFEDSDDEDTDDEDD
ncbi:hypothetical protein JCM10213_006386 [Rhodosporidiobolus nylandii]